MAAYALRLYVTLNADDDDRADADGRKLFERIQGASPELGERLGLEEVEFIDESDWTVDEV